MAHVIHRGSEQTGAGVQYYVSLRRFDWLDRVQGLGFRGGCLGLATPVEGN